MPRLLDVSRPYAEVCGLPGAMFEQDGLRFKFDGTEALDASPIVEEVIAVTEEIVPAITCIEQAAPPPENGKTLEEMHWKHLKAMVEAYGGEWVGRAEGIAFIRGKQ